MGGIWTAKVPKPQAIVHDKMHLCSMTCIRFSSAFRPLCLVGLVFFASDLWAQNTARASQGHAYDRPLDAKNAWPDGTFGVDFNVADGEGLRHGPWVRVYEEGQLYYAGEFDHGTPVGNWWYFRENGSALTHIVHQNDPTRSDATLFTKDGRIAAQGRYVHPELKLTAETLQERPATPARDGVWSLFSSTGNLTATITYDHGQKEGLQERLLPSGAVYERGNFRSGEMHGTWNAWHDNGLLRQKITYRNGTLDGPFAAFYGSGGRLSEGAYLEGAEEGSWKFYLEDGRLQHIHRYRDGKLLETIHVNGTFTTWFGEERPATEVNYRDKQLDGPFREWHDQGGFVLETFTDADTGEEMQRRVMKGIQVSREGEYVEGLLDGPVYHYNTTGRLTHTEHYNMGALERTETH